VEEAALCLLPLVGGHCSNLLNGLKRWGPFGPRITRCVLSVAADIVRVIFDTTSDPGGIG